MDGEVTGTNEGERDQKQKAAGSLNPDLLHTFDTRTRSQCPEQPHCTHGNHQAIRDGTHDAGPESFFGFVDLHRLNSGLESTPGVTRTLDLRIWNPLLCQLSYWRMNATWAAVVRTGHSQVPPMFISA